MEESQTRSTGNENDMKQTTAYCDGMPRELRLVGVKADWTSSGFILPTSWVNVAWKPRGASESRDKILLQGAYVYAVETGCWLGDSAPPPPTVTLAVTPDEAKQLSRAMEQGTIGLNLLPMKTVTLSVTLDQAKQLSHAMEQGAIPLILLPKQGAAPVEYPQNR